MPIPIQDVDESTLMYVAAAQRPFEDLRQALGQVSGWLVLAALRTRDAVGDHPALTGAAALVRECCDQLGTLPATTGGQLHHDCLRRAARTLDEAIREARARHIRTAADIEHLSRTVKRAYDDLARATGTLPGFQMVSFAHACCARQERA